MRNFELGANLKLNAKIFKRIRPTPFTTFSRPQIARSVTKTNYSQITIFANHY